MRSETSYPVRCRECGAVIAVRDGNRITASLLHRTKKKVVIVTLVQAQKMTIFCDKCGERNEIVGS